MRLRILILLVLVTGCGGWSPGTMVRISPPRNWEATLERERATKDDFFRRSQESPLLAADVDSFDGLEYWGPDPGLFYVGPIHVNAQRVQFEMLTTAGQSRPCERFGWIEFPIEGMPQRLEVYRLLDMERGTTMQSLLLPFADGTTGQETYPSGRYVDLDGPEGEIHISAGPDGRPIAVGPFVLDFNRAFNPSCAYGAPERFACPVTPRENKLKVRIEAGERGFKLPENIESG